MTIYLESVRECDFRSEWKGEKSDEQEKSRWIKKADFVDSSVFMDYFPLDSTLRFLWQQPLLS